MLARGSKDKKTAKFNGLTTLKSAALLPIVAALAAGCASSGGDKSADDAEFGFEADTVEVAPEPVQAAPAQEDDFKVTIHEPEAVKAKPAPKPKVVAIRDGAPSRYTVQKGDTLWGIANKFLSEPWLWPEVWYFNPQIVNPHLIYPGDTLVMSYVGDRPQIRVVRPGQATVVSTTTQAGTTAGGVQQPTKVVKLAPRVRAESIESAIPTVPINAISSFLHSSRVFTEDELNEMPQIVGSLDDHMVSGPGNTVYAINVPEEELRFDVVRRGRIFRHHKTKEILGVEGLEIGKVKMLEQATPEGVTSFLVTETSRELLKYDLLTQSASEEISNSFIPSSPSVEVEGEIIALHNAIANVASNQVVIVDIGSRDGLEAGNVLAIDQAGEMVRQKIPGTERSRLIKMPPARAGLALVFKVYDRVSYALIIDSNRSIHLNDKVRNPEISKDI